MRSSEPSSPLRFVVVHHTGFGEAHFDLMIEREPGGALATWRFPTWPIADTTDVEPLGDHRRDYLEYQGPVSRDRGQVRRVDQGTCLAVHDSKGEFTITFLTPPGRLMLVITRSPKRCVARIVNE